MSEKWRLISDPPKLTERQSSIRVMVFSKEIGVGWGWYTRYASGVTQWLVQHWPVTEQPTHWQPVPLPPEGEAEKS